MLADEDKQYLMPGISNNECVDRPRCALADWSLPEGSGQIVFHFQDARGLQSGTRCGVLLAKGIAQAWDTLRRW